MGTYHQAQICLNGHAITSAADQCPELKENFCSKCGAETVMSCPSCGVAIRGRYDVPGFIDLANTYHPPLYCHNCGSPYPWTKTAMEAIQELIWEDDDLFDDEKDRLCKSLPDIVAETPKTTLAVSRVKKSAMRGASILKDALIQFAIDFGCELAKKQLGL